MARVPSHSQHPHTPSWRPSSCHSPTQASPYEPHSSLPPCSCSVLFKHSTIPQALQQLPWLLPVNKNDTFKAFYLGSFQTRKTRENNLMSLVRPSPRFPRQVHGRCWFNPQPLSAHPALPTPLRATNHSAANPGQPIFHWQVFQNVFLEEIFKFLKMIILSLKFNNARIL